ncbi:hypothetical protein [uncultured Phocaeicola sp.]|jgi:hypothetical protein|nr:hypothetical protein [uncultured Phocaeicola sp.]
MKISRIYVPQESNLTPLISQISRKIYVYHADLDAFLRRHRIEGNK